MTFKFKEETDDVFLDQVLIFTGVEGLSVDEFENEDDKPTMHPLCD